MTDTELQLISTSIMQSRGLISALEQADTERAQRLAENILEGLLAHAKAGIEHEATDELTRSILTNIVQFDLASIEADIER